MVAPLATATHRHSNLRRPLVFNAGMDGRSLRRALCGVTAAALLVPAEAPARIIEIGETAGPSAPSCPASPCQAISRTTAYQKKGDTHVRSFVVPRNGRIVAWSITLGAPSTRQREFFETSLGGPARAGITLLRPRKKPRKEVLRTIVGLSPVQELTSYFGQTVQFPLETTIAARRGDIVALTVPTWAPALQLGLGRRTSWRASRPWKKCGNTSTQTAQVRLSTTTGYRCRYRTASLTYTATLITNPVPADAETAANRRG